MPGLAIALNKIQDNHNKQMMSCVTKTKIEEVASWILDTTEVQENEGSWLTIDKIIDNVLEVSQFVLVILSVNSLAIVHCRRE